MCSPRGELLNWESKLPRSWFLDWRTQRWVEMASDRKTVKRIPAQGVPGWPVKSRSKGSRFSKPSQSQIYKISSSSAVLLFPLVSLASFIHLVWIWVSCEGGPLDEGELCHGVGLLIYCLSVSMTLIQAELNWFVHSTNIYCKPTAGVILKIWWWAETDTVPDTRSSSPVGENIY